MRTTSEPRLRPASREDLPILFEFQLDPESNRLAGTRPRDRAGFEEVWARNLAGTDVVARVIEVDGAVAGAISCFPRDGASEIGYWIGRAHWGRGVASRALALFLEEVRARPLHATVATANVGSVRVLERNGFRRVGVEMGEETERYVACEIARYVLGEE